MTKMSKSQDFKTRIENFSACIQHKINTSIDNFQGDQKCHKIKIALQCTVYILAVVMLKNGVKEIRILRRVQSLKCLKTF